MSTYLTRMGSALLVLFSHFFFKRLIGRYRHFMVRFEHVPTTTRWKRSQFVSIASVCLLLLGLSVVEAADKAGAAATRAEVVWSEFEGGKSHIYYSALIGPGWTDKVALPDSGADNIMPCIARTDDGVSWVVWIAEGVDGTRLFYSYSKGEAWSEAKEIPTGLSLNVAPSIAVIKVDKEDRPVIVWVGRDDKQESHIFFSMWNGTDWEKASRVDRGDSKPNVIPLIGTNPNGALWVCWYGFDGTLYKPYSSEWYYDKSEGAWRWSDAIESDTDNLFKVQLDRRKKKEIPELPDFIPDPVTAGVYVIGEGRLKHIAMRYFGLKALIEGIFSSNRVVTQGAQVPAGSAILAFGDSITQGWPYITELGDGRTDVGGYELRLQGLLGRTVYNWGYAGEGTLPYETSIGGVNRIDQVLATSSSGDYILIMEGLNDRWIVKDPETTKTNLGLMIDKSRLKDVTPILATLTPDGRVYTTYMTYSRDAEIKDQYNPRIRDLASEKGVILAEQYYNVRPNWDYLTQNPDDGFEVDYFHPHMDGYDAIAAVWYMAITGQKMVPTVTTRSISSITPTGALSGGYVTLDGGASVTARGVCWSTTANPTTANSHTTNGTGTANFGSTIGGLSPGTTYHVRAYATNNSVGTGYGSDVSFTTLTTPTVTTAAISSITATSASGGGNVTSDGGASVTARGVCWSTTANPTTANSHTTNGTGTGSFTSSITGLNPLTIYHVRAYATNSAGTAYGSDVSFTTLTTPTVTTAAISSITATSASSGGNVTSDGGASVTARGVCWSTTANPTTANSHTTNGTGTGSFTSLITGLNPLTTYHVRSYATNSVGTAYGDDVTFKTTCSGGAIVIQNTTFEGGTTTVCECTQSITIGPGVTIKSNADVTFKAPIVTGVPVLTIQNGAKVRITPTQ